MKGNDKPAITELRQYQKYKIANAHSKADTLTGDAIPQGSKRCTANLCSMAIALCLRAGENEDDLLFPLGLSAASQIANNGSENEKKQVGPFMNHEIALLKRASQKWHWSEEEYGGYLWSLAHTANDAGYPNESIALTEQIALHLQGKSEAAQQLLAQVLIHRAFVLQAQSKYLEAVKALEQWLASYRQNGWHWKDWYLDAFRHLHIAHWELYRIARDKHDEVEVSRQFSLINSSFEEIKKVILGKLPEKNAPNSYLISECLVNRISILRELNRSNPDADHGSYLEVKEILSKYASSNEAQKVANRDAVNLGYFRRGLNDVADHYVKEHFDKSGQIVRDCQDFVDSFNISDPKTLVEFYRFRAGAKTIEYGQLLNQGKNEEALAVRKEAIECENKAIAIAAKNVSILEPGLIAALLIENAKLCKQYLPLLKLGTRSDVALACMTRVCSDLSILLATPDVLDYIYKVRDKDTPAETHISIARNVRKCTALLATGPLDDLRPVIVVNLQVLAFSCKDMRSFEQLRTAARAACRQAKDNWIFRYGHRLLDAADGYTAHSDFDSSANFRKEAAAVFRLLPESSEFSWSPARLDWSLAFEMEMKHKIADAVAFKMKTLAAFSKLHKQNNPEALDAEANYLIDTAIFLNEKAGKKSEAILLIKKAEECFNLITSKDFIERKKALDGKLQKWRGVIAN